MMRSPVGCGQGVRAHEDESDGDAAGAFGAVERRTSGEATWKERRCVGVERGSYAHGLTCLQRTIKIQIEAVQY